MNVHSKLELRLARSVVAASCFAVLLSFGSNAASQSAPVTIVPTNPAPTAPAPQTPAPQTHAAPAPSAPTPSAPAPGTPVPAAGAAAAAAPAAEPVAPATPAAGTEFTATEKPAPVVLGEGETELAEPPPARGPFSRGAVRLTLLLGTASTRNDNYFIIGAGLGYFLVNGLEIGLDYEAWLFANPVLHRVSPEARYVFHMVPVIKPYAGIFYRRTFVTDADDYNQVGGRLGAYYVPRSGRMYIGGGAVYERRLDCDSNEYDCDSWYPEISFGISL